MTDTLRDAVRAMKVKGRTPYIKKFNSDHWYISDQLDLANAHIADYLHRT